MTIYKYINFIGTDGSGKDTIFNLIKKDYPDALLTKEPGGCTTADIIREILLSVNLNKEQQLGRIAQLLGMEVNHQTRDLLLQAIIAINEENIEKAEPFLYAASRSESIEKKVKPAIKQGNLILGRRSAACSVAYQGKARGFGMKTIWDLNYPIVQSALPTLEIFFDIPIPDALNRIKNRSEKQDRLDLETQDFFEKVRTGYLEFYQEICPYPYIFIDATKGIEELTEEVSLLVRDHLNTHNEREKVIVPAEPV